MIGNTIGFGWMCAGIGVSIIILGVIALFGWITVPTLGHTIAILVVGLVMTGFGALSLIAASIAHALGRRSLQRGD